MNALIAATVLGIVLLYMGLTRKNNLIAPAGIAGLVIILILVIKDWGASASLFNNMMVFDNFSISFNSIMVFITILIFHFSIGYYKDLKNNIAENFALMLFSLAGAFILTSFSNLLMLFLGIEIMTIPLYLLAGGKKKSFRANEASFKYFLLGSFSSAIFMFGVALVYGATATFDLSEIFFYITQNHAFVPMMFKTGILMILVGMAFKVAAVPFHFWSPDVYEGSPTIVTMFMSTVVKIAGFAALYRLLDKGGFHQLISVDQFLWIITLLTLLIGNITAIYQKNFKRLLAYSSIANSGFLLLAILTGDQFSANSLLYYSLTYSLATFLAFSIFFTVKSASGGNEHIDIFNNLWKANPFVAVLLTIALLSLAGIPPLAGFFAKFFILMTMVKNGYLWITIFSLLMVLAGIYYYFLIIRKVFSPGKDDNRIATFDAATFTMTGNLLCAFLLLVLGLWPFLITIF